MREETTTSSHSVELQVEPSLSSTPVLPPLPRLYKKPNTASVVIHSQRRQPRRKEQKDQAGALSSLLGTFRTGLVQQREI